jgi:transcriptional regulator with PAS, ATPase and Fis domain
MNRDISHIPEEVMSILQRHQWPGNIRELQNFLNAPSFYLIGSTLHLLHVNSTGCSRTKHPI